METKEKKTEKYKHRDRVIVIRFGKRSNSLIRWVSWIYLYPCNGYEEYTYFKWNERL